MLIVRAILLALVLAEAINAHGYDQGWSDGRKPTKCPTGFFNFGDSLTDTGGALNSYPYETDAEFLPYGEKFFGKPSKRFSNGRLVPDFFALAFEQPLLSAYFQTSAFDYRHGVNFAVGGATASNDTTRVPFFLTFQVAQFVRFKRESLSAQEQNACSNFQRFLPKKKLYTDALYTITIGGNDIIMPLLSTKTAEEIITSVIPGSMLNFVHAFKTLYSEGARHFLLFNLPPAGCASVILTLVGGLGLPSDSLGCVEPINQLDQLYNLILKSTIADLREALPEATISIFDYYSANIEILTNPAKYGFNPNKTLIACCGAPGLGAYNYNPSAACGRTNSNTCDNPDEYVNWDGVHFTDSFYKLISKWALSGKFTDIPINYKRYCGLNFSRFGDKVTYDEVYGGSCNVQDTYAIIDSSLKDGGILA